MGLIPAGRWWWRLTQLVVSFLPQALGLLAAAVALAVLIRSLSRRGPAGGAARIRQAAALVVLLGGLTAAAWPLLGRPRAGSSLPAPIQTATEWSTFMGNMSRTGSADSSPGPASASTRWAFRDGLNRAAFAGSAAVVAGRVYVGSDNRQLYCFDARDGRVLWRFTAACELFASPAVADGRVFVGEGLHHHTNAKVYCLDAASGDKLWEFQTSSHVEFAPTVDGGKVFVAAGEDGVYCLDAASGRKLWRYPGVHADCSPAVTDTGVFFGAVYGQPFFFCLNPDDGRVVWRRPAPHGVTSSPSTEGRRVYFGLGNGTFEASHAAPLGAVWCLDVADGRTVWATTQVKDTVLTSVALSDGRAFFASRDGRVFCVDAATGSGGWTFDAPDTVLSSPAVADRRVYFGCNDGAVYCLDAVSGRQLWSFDTSAAAFNPDARVLASPAIAGGRLYIGSMNFFFFCLGENP